METINIIFSSDNNYAQYMGVAICSLFENKTCPNKIDIYVLDGGISDNNKIKLKILENRYGFKINYIKMDVEFFKNFYTSHYVTQAAYYRLIVPEVLHTIDKILYLDCDIIVNKDIQNLYNINIDEYFLAGVEDMEISNSRNQILKIPSSEKYFNSGVILINLKNWRKSNITEKTIHFIKQNPDKLKFWDQDAMNAILWGKWLEIPVIYNYLSMFFENKKYNFENIKKDIIIIHYAGSKPWDYLSTNISRKYYFMYLKKTPWKNRKYINKNIRNILVKKILILIPLIFPNFIIKKLKTLKKRIEKFY